MSLAFSIKTDNGNDLRFLEAFPLLSPMTKDRLLALKVANEWDLGSALSIDPSFLLLSSFRFFFLVLGVCTSFPSFRFCFPNALNVAPSVVSSANFTPPAGIPIS